MTTRTRIEINQAPAVVVGVFGDQDSAEQAIHQLHAGGFRYEDIGFVEPTQFNPRVSPSEVQAIEPETGARVASGAIAGAGVGGLVAAGVAFLVPGFGPVVAGGILAAILGGAGLGAAAGGLIGALTRMGIPEEEARRYQDEVRAGNVLVTLRADRHAAKARKILRDSGAQELRTDHEANGRAA
jgi:hypothetical protein